MTSRLRALPGLAALLSGLWLVVSLARIWWSRVQYPFDLEWMEGGMLAHSWRLLAGLPLYPEPGPDFIPFVYPPGYASVLALVAGPIGLDYPVGRLLSLAGSLAAALALVTGLWRHGGDRLAAVAAGCVFLGTYPESGAFFDLVRPDGMFLALLAWSAVIALERARGAPEAAGLLLAAAFVTKHNAAIFGLPLALGVALRSGRPAALRFSVAAAAPALLLIGFMQGVSGGRFLVYLLAVPMSHPGEIGRIWPDLPREVGAALPVATATTATWLVWQTWNAWTTLPPATIVVPVAAGVGTGLAGHLWTGAQYAAGRPPGTSALANFALGATVGALLLLTTRPRTSARNMPWTALVGLATALTAVAITVPMRYHNGGYLNVYLPLHWVLAASFGAVVCALRAGSGGGALLGDLALLAQLGWQVGALDPAKLVPTREDADAGRAFVRELRGLRGPIFSPHAAWLPVQVDRPPSLHFIALWDLDHPGGPYRDRVGVIDAAIAARRWSVALEGTVPVGHGLLTHYRERVRPEVPPQRFMPRTGWQVRPAAILVPREPGDLGSGPGP